LVFAGPDYPEYACLLSLIPVKDVVQIRLALKPATKICRPEMSGAVFPLILLHYARQALAPARTLRLTLSRAFIPAKDLLTLIIRKNLLPIQTI
jgi:hypothetical protein